MHWLTCTVCNPLTRWRRRRVLRDIEANGHATWAKLVNSGMMNEQASR